MKEAVLSYKKLDDDRGLVARAKASLLSEIMIPQIFQGDATNRGILAKESVDLIVDLYRFNSALFGVIIHFIAKQRRMTRHHPSAGCIHHSDRGSQYCAYDYQKLLKAHGLVASMSGKGNAYDNAACETFFKTIKAELVWRGQWITREQTNRAIASYIGGFYNPRRRHSAIGYLSPIKFEASQRLNYAA